MSLRSTAAFSGGKSSVTAAQTVCPDQSVHMRDEDGFRCPECRARADRGYVFRFIAQTDSRFADDLQFPFDGGNHHLGSSGTLRDPYQT